MKPINFTLPNSWQCVITGCLYESDNPDDLSEDMIEVAVPRGFLVCAGWFDDLPEGPGYLVTATQGLLNVIDPIRETNPADVVDVMREVIDNLRPRGLSRSYGKTADVSAKRPFKVYA
jgi:hypothetical protein